MKIVPLRSAPLDVVDSLRLLSEQVEAGRVGGIVIASIVDGGYEFVYAASLSDAIVMSTMLQQNCIDRMRA